MARTMNNGAAVAIRWRGWLIAVAAALVAGCGSSERASAESPPGPMPIGTNLGGVMDWSSDLAFVDVFMSSRHWIAQKTGGDGPWDTGETIELTPLGWPLVEPGQAAATLMCRGIGGRYPAGRYIVSYEGSGDIAFGLDAKIERQTAGQIELKVEPSNGGIFMRIDRSLHDDPIRNVRVTMPGFENHPSPFHPRFIERLQPFQVIRYLNWQRINGSEVEHWSDRTTLEHAQQSRSAGVALEYMIELSNQTRIDPWFCMPHLADDDYVRRFAEMVRDRLDPRLKVYVEYSNEIWNGIFGQSRYARERGLELGLSDNDYQAQLRYQSQRSVEIFRIWEEVFSGSDRLVRVMAAHHVNPWTSEQLLSWQDAHEHVDALAIAPYFGHSVLQEIAKDPELVGRATVDDVLDMAEQSMAKLADQVAAQKRVADAYGVKLIAYEGGQHLVAPRGSEHAERLVTLGAEANRHPRMYDLYARLFETWHRNGGEMFATFTYMHQPGRSGAWGLLEYQTQPTEHAPKYQATMDAIEGRLGTTTAENQGMNDE